MLSLILLYIGLLSPAYVTFKSIKNNNTDDQQRWLKYWVCFSILLVVQKFADLLISWLPFYSILKLVFVYFLAHQSKPAVTEFMFDLLKRAVFDPNQAKFDACISMIDSLGDRMRRFSMARAKAFIRSKMHYINNPSHIMNVIEDCKSNVALENNNNDDNIDDEY
ncbi:hypothetical protein P9112_009894 [Eukaryota sp. TZLM1-RC]